jgi:hypothetical protein
MHPQVHTHTLCCLNIHPEVTGVKCVVFYNSYTKSNSINYIYTHTHTHTHARKVELGYTVMKGTEYFVSL